MPEETEITKDQAFDLLLSFWKLAHALDVTHEVDEELLDEANALQNSDPDAKQKWTYLDQYSAWAEWRVLCNTLKDAPLDQLATQQ